MRVNIRLREQCEASRGTAPAEGVCLLRIRYIVLRHDGLTANLAKCGVTACEIETLRGLLVE